MIYGFLDSVCDEEFMRLDEEDKNLLREALDKWITFRSSDALLSLNQAELYVMKKYNHQGITEKEKYISAIEEILKTGDL